jgi:cyclophilin family peptidyl-prolyl cis-trans isomerase
MKRLIARLSILALGLSCVMFSHAAHAQSAASAGAKKPAPQAAGAKPTSDYALRHPELLTKQAPAEFDAKFTTTKGDFVIHVTRAWAPLGADRFYNLVRRRFYDGASFFRVVPDFVIQFGLGPDPVVNKAWTNATIKDDPVKESNKIGSVTYAKPTAPNARTTQVFINLGNNTFLDAQGFAPFGQVSEGMDVVKSLYSGYRDAPTDHQEEITNQGKAYLEKNFPKLDSIKTAIVVQEAGGAAAAAKPAAKPKD